MRVSSVGFSVTCRRFLKKKESEEFYRGEPPRRGAEKQPNAFKIDRKNPKNIHVLGFK